MYLNTLDVCFLWLLRNVQSGHLLEVSAPFLRVSLFLLNVLDVFGGGSKVFGNFSLFPTKYGWYVPSDLFWGIRSCCQVWNLTAHLSTVPLGYLSLILPAFSGRSQNFSEGLLLTRERCPWKSSTRLLFSSPLYKEGLGGMLPFSPTGF